MSEIEKMQLAIVAECERLKPTDRGIETEWGALYDSGDHYQFWAWGSFCKFPKHPKPTFDRGITFSVYRMMGLNEVAQAAEIKRLREALEGIAASTYSHAQHARRNAENALKPQESEK